MPIILEMAGTIMKAKYTVSLCMIAKDEATSIRSCILSCKHLVDEIIVVDTGSQDQTPALAEDLGATVFPFAWSENFAAARNTSIRYAHSDWILVLDADEILENVSPADFQALLTVSDIEGYFIQISNLFETNGFSSTDHVVRLFRNNPNYRFEGALHEQVAASILQANEGRGLSASPLQIWHYGYLKTRIAEKNKFKRNTEILMRELSANPNHPFFNYCLALEYYGIEDIPKGLQHLNLALQTMSGTEGFFEDVILNIALGYILKPPEDAVFDDFILKALTLFPKHPYLLLFHSLRKMQCGQIHAAQDDIQQIISDLSNAPPTSMEFLLISLKEISLYFDAQKQDWATLFDDSGFQPLFDSFLAHLCQVLVNRPLNNT